MVFDNNFRVVGRYSLIDSVLKLHLTQGRWTPESAAKGGTQTIKLNFDPEIQADRLTMPIPAERLKRQAILGPITQDWQVFESEKSCAVVEIIIDITEHDDEVRLVFGRGQTLDHTASLFAKYGGPVEANPYFYILYMIQSLVLMEDWKEAFAVPWGKAKVTIYVDRAIAEALAAHTDFDFDRSVDCLVCMATREVKS